MEQDRIKILCIGDPHIKTNNILESENMIESIEKVALERRPDLIICLGDILDKHASLHVECLLTAEKMIEKLSMIAPFFLIIGNHDRPNNSVFLNNKHAFNSYKRWNNVCIVDEVVSITLKNNKFLFVPYVPNKRFIEAINTKIKTEELVEYVAIFCHQEFYGCKIGSKISEGGDKMEDVNLNENISKRFPIIISGHIHDYERLGNNEIIYVGTPVQQTFAESHDKAISLFTFFHDENKKCRIMRTKQNGKKREFI